MTNKFEGSSWAINLPGEWQGEHEEECSTIYDPDGVGALQISVFKKDGTVTESDLKGFASDHIEVGAKLTPATCGDFEGFTLSYGTADEFWQEWYLANGQNALYVTYNCDLEDRHIEESTIVQILSALNAT